jgi:hypothetical protein
MNSPNSQPARVPGLPRPVANATPGVSGSSGVLLDTGSRQPQRMMLRDHPLEVVLLGTDLSGVEKFLLAKGWETV